MELFESMGVGMPKQPPEIREDARQDRLKAGNLAILNSCFQDDAERKKWCEYMLKQFGYYYNENHKKVTVPKKERAYKLLEDGLSQTAVSKLLNVDPSTVCRWDNNREEVKENNNEQ